MGVFQIPGNIKQQYLPFVLAPQSKLNTKADASNELVGDIGAQHFSFRDRNKDQYKAGFGKLQICPSSLTDVNFGNYFKQDISYKVLFGDMNNKGWKENSITVNDIFNALPGIQIREFLPDTKLDQCINFFGDLLQSVKDMWADSDDANKEKNKKLKGKELREKQNQQSQSRWEQFKSILQHAFDYLTGVSKPSMYTREDGTPKFGQPSTGIYDKPGYETLNTYILSFPYTLYYRLQSCVTTNVYELPCKSNDAVLYSSDGKAGWTSGSNSIGITNTLLGKIPIIGDILKNILGNVQINFMPWWDAEKGSQTAPPDVDVSFDLFNDTADAAMINFIFVNTLVPNNKWIQYNMFQHSPCLYDIKLEGYNRLFACAGSFEVKAGGVMRNPPPGWIDRLVSTYGNGIKNELAGLIKIPDVYHVSMKFQSLLPNNFNTFLFTYSHNNKMETAYASGSLYQSSAFATMIQAATTDFVKEMKDYIGKLSEEATAPAETDSASIKANDDYTKKIEKMNDVGELSKESKRLNDLLATSGATSQKSAMSPTKKVELQRRIKMVNDKLEKLKK